MAAINIGEIFDPLVEEIVSHAAKQLFAEAGVTIAAHDNEVSLSPLRFRDQRGRDVPVSALGSMQRRLYPVVPKVIDYLGAEQTRFSANRMEHSIGLQPAEIMPRGSCFHAIQPFLPFKRAPRRADSMLLFIFVAHNAATPFR
jgi:hypothetical protein